MFWFLAAAILAASLYAIPLALRQAGGHLLAAWLFIEDGLIEGLGAAAVLAGGLLLLYAALFARAPHALARLTRAALGLLLIVMCGEEMNWGQRLLGFETPAWLGSMTETGEFNLHNLRQFQADWQVNPPTSWWQIGTFALLVLLPLAARWPAVRRLCERCGVPIASPMIAWLALGTFVGMFAATTYGLPPENSEIQETIVECLLLAWAVQAVRPDLVGKPAAWLMPIGAGALLLVACGARLLSIDPSEIHRERAEVFVSIGGQLVARGDATAAQSYLREALIIDPDNAAAHYLTGLIHLQRQEADAAIAALQRAVAREPELAPAHSSLGIALVSAGRLGEGRAALERALALDSQQADARQVLEQLKRAGH